MFGYVVPDKMNMFMKDFYAYKAYYCGLCKSIGKKCGQCMRFTTNYDVTFLNIFLHAVMGIVPEYSNETCILSPFKKKSIVKNDSLTEKVVDVNTLLTHYKLVDDKTDDKNLAKAFADRTIVRRRYKMAKANLQEIDKFYDEAYARLRELENSSCESVDRLADPFAQMLRYTVRYLSGDKYTEELGELFYCLGRWVYFMDAIDDVDDDFKDKSFNPFLVGYDYIDRQTFLNDNKDLLEMLLQGAYNRMSECYKSIKIDTNEGIITNILWYGISMRTKEILGRTTKCKTIRI